jgi:hypothetical protein
MSLHGDTEGEQQSGVRFDPSQYRADRGYQFVARRLLWVLHSAVVGNGRDFP